MSTSQKFKDRALLIMKYDPSKTLKENHYISEQETPAGGDTGGSTTSSSTSTQKKWESGRKLGKTYMNDPKYVWKSDRTMGKTYMGDPKYKWYSGVQRGHANPASES